MSSDISITGNFGDNCHVMIGHITVNGSQLECLTGYHECNSTYAVCHIIDGALDLGELYLTLEKGGLSFEQTLVGMVVPRTFVSS